MKFNQGMGAYKAALQQMTEEQACLFPVFEDYLSDNSFLNLTWFHNREEIYMGPIALKRLQILQSPHVVALLLAYAAQRLPDND